jgi:hypothetical protein
MHTRIAPAERITGTPWTAAQLRAVAECYETIQSHTLYGGAAVRLASRARLIDRSALTSLVAGTMGGREGTYWMVAAMTTAQLALSFPELLTEAEVSLLLAPLAAGERLADQNPVLAPAA